ncbi:hypothetical protein V6N11_031658 [Hibiscus sabdariffa]|uniref:Uncharacterized protein n=1 Tax=Hibiscus sabdariffa TaxID=183260 RepID=A0ABR2SYA1_9ROSI
MNAAATNDHSEPEDMLQDHTSEDAHDSLSEAVLPEVPNAEEGVTSPRIADGIEHAVEHEQVQTDDMCNQK